MKKFIITFSVLLCLSATTYAQISKNNLKEDLITMNDGKMICKNHIQVTSKRGNSFQVKFQMQNPSTELMSRDYFVLFSAIIQDELIKAVMKEYGLRKPQYKTKRISQPLKEANITIDCILTTVGMDVTMNSNGEESKFSRNWSQLLKNL